MAMPSLIELKEIAKNAGKNSLKEIEGVTKEKLSNKILKQFTLDLIVMLPIILIIMLEARTAY
jgi:hypothetical protein